ncbi:sulfatase family protein [Pontiella sulfatireligans]|uniref:Arylsulfatase n=1 Tax=Pontiella sulfatireligans TaxID=2750658 RepID=A0A6C2UJS7_9BACT|nr:arylsulfatase [Pontiella sulfatireligans]SPS74418.1 sulfatase S1_15 [Kiritimatiellales bacterium]VGO20475.1 Arylsulfatase [Pontiella sulfatireligans]
MNVFRIVLLSPLLLGLAVFAGSSKPPAKSAKPVAASATPNVVIIYGDDVGFGDVGVYGSKLIPTPNIDRLAAQGISFSDGHCSAATCTPSRFSMLTGIHAFRYNARILPPNAPLIIPTDKLTLPKLFKQAGYQTAVIGKWHLGLGVTGELPDWNGDVKPGPLEIGFDYSYLLPNTNDRVPCVYLAGHRVVNLDPADPIYVGKTLADVQKPGSTQYPDGKTNREAMTVYQSTHGHDDSVVNGIGRIGYMSGGKAALWQEDELTDVFVGKAKEYIAAHKDEPFFLYFASQDIHVPRYPHKRFRGKTKLGHRGDAMVAFDWATGEIMKALEKHGLTQNTIVIFSSDNGPAYDDGYDDGSVVECSQEESDHGHDASGIWRGGKYQIYEGGTRVPFILRWPARIKPGLSDAMVNQIDFMASFAALLDIELPADEAVDSRDTLDAFLGDDPIGLEFMVEESFGLALRHNDWKFIEPSKPKWPKGRLPIAMALHDLGDDPSEQVNLAQVHPEKTAKMNAMLQNVKKGSGVRETFK